MAIVWEDDFESGFGPILLNNEQSIDVPDGCDNTIKFLLVDDPDDATNQVFLTTQPGGTECFEWNQQYTSTGEPDYKHRAQFHPAPSFGSTNIEIFTVGQEYWIGYKFRVRSPVQVNSDYDNTSWLVLS